MKILLLSFLALLPFSVFGDCDQTLADYSTKLRVPYEDFTDLGLRKCADLRPVSKTALPGFIALTFYDNSLEHRKAGLAKLESYKCKSDAGCGPLFDLLDAHLKATGLQQSDYISKRAVRLRDKVRPLAPQRKRVYMTYPARHISVSIARDFQEVNALLGKPENFPRWAAGLSSSLKRVGDHWESESPMGKVKVVFTPPNGFGIADHDVTLPDGKTFHNPLRVLKNGTGCEVVFTLYRMPGVSDAEYEKDAGLIKTDLEKLKSLF